MKRGLPIGLRRARPGIGLLVLLCGAWPAGSLGGERISVWREGPQAGHYLAWQGRPVLLIGDSVTQGWMECGTNFDQNAYVDALAARGLNLLMIWAFKGTNARLQQADRRIGYDAPELWPWVGSPETASFDLHRFNPVYFDRLRQLVTQAESRGLAVLITVHDGWTKTCFEAHPFNRALGNGPLTKREQYVELADSGRAMPLEFNPAWNWQQQNQYFQERFCARLIQACQPGSNVVFELFNEGEWYPKTARRRHEEHFLAFFRAHSEHVLLSNADHITGFNPGGDPRVDVVTLHPQGWVGHFGKFAGGFRATPPKPYLYSEPVPEFDGEAPTLEVVRRSVWETALAGAGWVNQNDPSFGWDPRTAMALKAGPRDRAYDAAGHCARFFNRGEVRFWELAPAGELASTGVALARQGHEYIVYAATAEVFTVDLRAASGSRLNVSWYDPRRGEFRDGTPIAGGNPRQEFRSPFDGDAVLHLRTSTKAPGKT